MWRGLIVLMVLARLAAAAHAISNEKILACWQGAPGAEATMAACNHIIEDRTAKEHDLAWTYEHRAKLLSLKSRYAEAVADLDQAIALVPGFTKYRDRAFNLFMLNDHERGVAAYDTLIGLEPNENIHHERRAKLLAMKQVAAAEKDGVTLAPVTLAPKTNAMTATAPIAAPAPETRAPVAAGPQPSQESASDSATPPKRITASNKKSQRKTDCTAYVAAADLTISVPCPK